MAKLYPISTAHNHDEVYAKIGEGGGGVTDHGALSGLADNDHPQYLLTTFKGPIGLDSDQLVLNHDGSDADVELQFFRTTGGPFSIFWNGDIAWTTNAFRPSDLLINRISDTEPSNPKAGMVWLDTNG
jgi:hypothetical protein